MATKIHFLFGIVLLPVLLWSHSAAAQPLIIDVNASSVSAAAQDRLLWRDEFDVANSMDVARAVTVSGSNVIVAGQATVIGGKDIVVRSYDAKTGTVRWTDQFPDSSQCFNCDVHLTSQGGAAYLVTQGTDRRYPFGGTDIEVRAYDAENGNILWQDDFDEGRDDNPQSILATAKAFVVVGYTSGDPAVDGLQWIARAYDPVSGGILWNERVGDLPLLTTCLLYTSPSPRDS